MDITFGGEKPSQPKFDVGEWIEIDGEEPNNICALIAGADGTGKSGIVMSFLDTINKKHIILDLDGGCALLLNKQKNPKNFKIKNPIVFREDDEGNVTIDYEATINRIRATIKWVADNYNKKNIGSFTLDGLSTLLKYAEYQMREDTNLSVDQGVDLRYWKIRYQTFVEIIESAKALPMDKFFISHEDFLKKEDGTKISSIVEKTNQMMFQRIFCEKKEVYDVGTKKISYTATIKKSKGDLKLEGKRIEFGTILLSDEKEQKAIWKGDEVLSIFK